MGSCHYEIKFPKQNKCVYLRSKFRVSSIILTSFKQKERVIPPLPTPTPAVKGTSKNSRLT